MLGEPFFATGEELVKATRFKRVAELLGSDLREMTGALDIVIFDVAADLSVAGIIGEGPVAEKLRKDPDGVKLWIEERSRRCTDNSAGMSGGPTVEELSATPGLAKWLKSIEATDILGGNLVRGRFRSACVAAFKKDGTFTETEREKIRATVLITRCVLARLINDNYERRVLERLMNTRKETNNAVFLLRGDVAVPYNPGAVMYADVCWEKDEVEFTLSAESMRALNESLGRAWTGPVETHWTDVTVDLGGGALEVGALARPDSGILILFSPPSRQVLTGGTVPMLTRRQCDIMDWIAEGKTSAEVAIILEISPRTVEKHLEAVFQRFGVENRVAAVRTYLEAKGGLLPGQGA